MDAISKELDQLKLDIFCARRFGCHYSLPVSLKTSWVSQLQNSDSLCYNSGNSRDVELGRGGGGHHFPTKMENSGRCGVLCEIPSVVGVWIFFGTTHFLFKRIFHFVIEYSWISKLLHEVAIAGQLREALCRFYNFKFTCTCLGGILLLLCFLLFSFSFYHMIETLHSQQRLKANSRCRRNLKQTMCVCSGMWSDRNPTVLTILFVLVWGLFCTQVMLI